jgi:hypothetical protein
MEAEQWAHEKMREHGIRVAIACAAKRIDANARRFAKPAS